MIICERKRIARIRHEIAAGTYFTPEKVQIAVDCLVVRLLAGTLAVPVPNISSLRMPRTYARNRMRQKRTAHRWTRIA